MLVVMKRSATEANIAAVAEKIRELNCEPHIMPGANRTAIGITGNTGPFPPETFTVLAGVAHAIAVTKPYKLVSLEMRPEKTVVEISRPDGEPIRVGGDELFIIAGPCSVEGHEMLLASAKAAKAAGAHCLRGGAFKPRTNPYAFQGLGQEGLEILAAVRAETGMPIITEAIDGESLQLVAEYADVIQIGARNMQNFSLLRKVGKTRKPVLFKRGMSATLDEYLQAAEYILAGGNHQVILCERGVRTFSNHTRNTLDLSAVPVLKRMTHLPVLADPSHGTGNRQDVAPMAAASVASGADGLMIEVHPDPDTALSDGPQSLLLEELAPIIRQCQEVARAIGRKQTLIPTA